MNKSVIDTIDSLFATYADLQVVQVSLCYRRNSDAFLADTRASVRVTGTTSDTNTWYTDAPNMPLGTHLLTTGELVYALARMLELSELRLTPAAKAQQEEE